MRALKILTADLRVLKGYILQLAIMLVIILLMFLRSSIYFATNSLMFIGLLLTALPFTIEGTEKTPKFFATLPIKVSDIVASRYILLAGYYIIAGVADIIILSNTDFSGEIYKGIELRPFFIGTTAIIFLLAVFISSVQFPVFYKIGYEKGNFNSSALYMVPAILILFIYNSIISQDATKLAEHDIVAMIIENINLFVVLVGVVSVVLIAVSFFVSCFFLKQREFK